MFNRMLKKGKESRQMKKKVMTHARICYFTLGTSKTPEFPNQAELSHINTLSPQGMYNTRGGFKEKVLEQKFI